MEFVKAHGAGNDFVLLPDLDDRIDLDADLTRALCAPHFGLGADGVIRVGRPRNDRDDVFMDYRNADGSVAEMCGNGVRCVAKYVLDRGTVAGDELRVDTRGGSKLVRVARRHVDGCIATLRVDMGEPVVATIDWSPTDDPHAPASGETAGPALRLTSVDMGNPHAVYVTDDVAGTPLEQLATQINRLPAFAEGVNVEAVEVRDRAQLRGRIHERGVGETMASGTGVSAMAVAAIVRGLADHEVRVAVPGGELLVEWSGSGSVSVTGPAVEVAHGTLDATWLTTIR